MKYGVKKERWKFKWYRRKYLSQRKQQRRKEQKEIAKANSKMGDINSNIILLNVEWIKYFNQKKNCQTGFL